MATPVDAANRTAADVYGNLLALAAVVPLSAFDLSKGPPGRLRGEPSSLRLLFTGVGLSVVGAVVVEIKVVLTH